MNGNIDIALLLLFAAFFCVGVWVFFYGFSRFRRKRLIENIPTSTVRSMAMGLVEIAGIASASGVTAPFSRQACAYYRFEVKRFVKSRKNPGWNTILNGDSSRAPFYVDDGTGKISVEPSGAEIIVKTGFSLKTRAGEQLPENILEFMREKGWMDEYGSGRHALCFEECVIKNGQKVYVLGTAGNKNASPESQEEKVLKRLNELKESGFKGMKDISSVAQELLSASLKPGSIPAGDVVTISAGNNNEVFIISGSSQKDLLKHLVWEAAVCIACGTILSLSASCLFLVNLRF